MTCSNFRILLEKLRFAVYVLALSVASLLSCSHLSRPVLLRFVWSFGVRCFKNIIDNTVHVFTLARSGGKRNQNDLSLRCIISNRSLLVLVLHQGQTSRQSRLVTIFAHRLKDTAVTASLYISNGFYSQKRGATCVLHSPIHCEGLA